MIKVGNAPVSYGAFEVTVGKHQGVPSATEVLDAVQAAGYAGIDLGPVGYLGLGADLREALESRRLALAGGYVEIDVASPGAGFAELNAVCDQFDAACAGPGGHSARGGTPPNPRWPGTPGESDDKLFLPRPTVALIGDRPELVEQVVGDVVSTCAARGYQAVLHNEVGTLIAGQDSIIRVLESTDAALCLDTGHLVAAGGDPLAILAGWWDRVAHVHIKDSRSAGPFATAMELWEGDVFCRLGEGVGRVDEVLDALRAGGYAGWILVEQDVLPRSVEAYRQASADQQVNRKYLSERGW
jgi:inosose dehydratase